MEAPKNPLLNRKPECTTKAIQKHNIALHCAMKRCGRCTHSAFSEVLWLRTAAWRCGSVLRWLGPQTATVAPRYRHGSATVTSPCSLITVSLWLLTTANNRFLQVNDFFSAHVILHSIQCNLGLYCSLDQPLPLWDSHTASGIASTDICRSKK